MNVKAILSVDTSGSMSGKKLSDSKDALVKFTEKLPPEAQVGIISFNGGGAKLIQRPTSSTESIKASLKKLSASGKTPLHAGLKRSYNQFKQFQKQGLKEEFLKAVTPKGRTSRNKHRRHIVVSTDGKANMGPRNKGILKLGTKIKGRGIDIITVAIGKKADTELLRKLASGKENFHKTDFSGELPDTYEEIAKGITPKEG